MIPEWQLDDAPNMASMTTTFVLDGSPILRVYHDYEGGWQFHGSPDQPATTSVALLVSLGSMIARDPSLAVLYDLPCGWRAFRMTLQSQWQREKNNPFPTHAENGYYLEDAVWLSQYRDDVNPPSDEVRDTLSDGTYVKLLFRFRAENADRQDNDTERMWVLIIAVDDDGFYVGTLENDPNHDHILSHGDTIHFHPLHVMEVMTANSA